MMIPDFLPISAFCCKLDENYGQDLASSTVTNYNILCFMLSLTRRKERLLPRLANLPDLFLQSESPSSDTTSSTVYVDRLPRLQWALRRRQKKPNMTTTRLGILGHPRSFRIPTRVCVDLDFQTKLPGKKRDRKKPGGKKSEKSITNALASFLSLPFFRCAHVWTDG